MPPLPTNTDGIAYRSNGYALGTPKRPWPTGWRIVLFATIYLCLSALYTQAAGTPVERFFLETLGSEPAAALVRWFSPAIDASAKGARIAAMGGGLNIRNGCEGVDLCILLTAAFCAAPLSWTTRIVGLVLGLAFAVLLNQARILALFYAFRSDKALFDLLHSTALPILLVVLIGLYFHTWLNGWRR